VSPDRHLVRRRHAERAPDLESHPVGLPPVSRPLIHLAPDLLTYKDTRCSSTS
jgi:hypothetical protein